VIPYILQRIGYGFLVLLGVVILVFFLFSLAGVDPARMTLGQRADLATIENVRKEFNLDLPVYRQFQLYLNDISPISLHNSSDTEARNYLDPEKYHFASLVTLGSQTLVLKRPYLRRSFQTRRDVTELLLERIPNTIILAISAMVLATILGIMLGVLAAVNHNTPLDQASVALSVLGISFPSYFSAVVFQLIFAYLLVDLTGLNLTGDLYVADQLTGKETLVLKNLILPAVVLGLRPIAVIVQLTRSSMLDVLSLDYVRTARAKGLSERVVLFRHALRNALNPVVTAVSGWFAELLAGAFFVEVIFDYKGLGFETVEALKKFDFPVLMGAILFTATIFVIINILVDLLYSILDPRVSVKGKS
jgi:peptide/nickel transport system permease protein